MVEHEPLEAALIDLLTLSLRERGYALVRVKPTAGGQYLNLQVVAERADLRPMTVQDCVTISHIATGRLDRAGVSSDVYTLEVTAPGRDRPLVRIEDFERFKGHMAVVDLQTPVDGARRFTGRIVRVTGAAKGPELELHTSQGSIRFPVERIAGARLSVEN